MSAGVVATSGYVPLLAALTDGLAATLHLYTNDPPITPDRVAADFTEVIYAGYALVGLSKWTPPAYRAGSAFTVADPAVFQFGGGALPLPVRGCFVTDGPAGALLWAWRRPDPAFQFSPGTPNLSVLVTLALPAVIFGAVQYGGGGEVLAGGG